MTANAGVVLYNQPRRRILQGWPAAPGYGSRYFGLTAGGRAQLQALSTAATELLARFPALRFQRPCTKALKYSGAPNQNYIATMDSSQTVLADTLQRMEGACSAAGLHISWALGNSLPNALRLSFSYSAFRSSLKTFFFPP